MNHFTSSSNGNEHHNNLTVIIASHPIRLLHNGSIVYLTLICLLFCFFHLLRFHKFQLNPHSKIINPGFFLILFCRNFNCKTSESAYPVDNNRMQHNCIRWKLPVQLFIESSIYWVINLDLFKKKPWQWSLVVIANNRILCVIHIVMTDDELQMLSQHTNFTQRIRV